MCFTYGWSIALSVGGTALTAYAFRDAALRETGYAYLCLFYTGMEVLQLALYHDLNRCGSPYNRTMTEVGFVLVVVQPALWNLYFLRNAVAAARPAFTLATALAVVWIAGFVGRRLVGLPGVDFEVTSTLETCTVKGPRNLHFAWGWVLRRWGGLEANWFMYLSVWFVPQLLFFQTDDDGIVPSGVGSAVIVGSGLVVSLILSSTIGTLHEIPSTWCLMSVPILAVPVSVHVLRTRARAAELYATLESL